MFQYIRGEITETEPGAVVIECGGIGYRASVSAQTLSKCCRASGATKLYTYLNVREDGVDLFGFADRDELRAFELLITVSGVGPKAAISILSIFTPEGFARAVSTEDTRSLSKASGVGAKTAARIVLELRDKVAKQLGTGGTSESTAAIGDTNDKLTEAQNALLVLGYTRSEAVAALGGIDTSQELETIIRIALSRLMK